MGADRVCELSFPPRLGEHNALVYGEVLGMGEKRLAELKKSG